MRGSLSHLCEYPLQVEPNLLGGAAFYTRLGLIFLNNTYDGIYGQWPSCPLMSETHSLLHDVLGLKLRLQA